MFTITDHRGFHMKFANGYSVSVQWGTGNYCERRSYVSGSYDAPARDRNWSSPTAEVAVFDPAGEFTRVPNAGIDWNDDVAGWVNADDVATLITAVAAIPAPVPA